MEKFHSAINEQLINLNISRKIPLTGISLFPPVRRVWCNEII